MTCDIPHVPIGPEEVLALTPEQGRPTNTQTTAIMPGEIFNPNPVVFSAPKARQSDLLAHSLWINDASASEDEADELEAIDQDEIFGLPLNPRMR